MTIGWIHPNDVANIWKGENDAGMEWFRDKPLVKLAREGIQNSLDANRHSTRNETVIVKFRFDEVDSRTIPNIEDLENNIKCAKWSHTNKYGDTSATSKKLIKNYDRSLKTLSGEKVPIFQISDSNTTGMNEDDFYIYIKGDGLSPKDAGKGGSFGIGKMAPFVVSDLKTIIASTVYSDGQNYRQLTQGKSVLTTFISKDQKKVATGYWGNEENFDPVSGVNSNLPDWFQHSNLEQLSSQELGTTITALGFREDLQQLWHQKVALAVIENFFAAIYEGDLEVQIGTKYRLNKDSLIDTITDSEFIKKIKDSSGDEGAKQLELTKNYLSMLDDNQPGVILRVAKLPYLGLCELRIKTDDSFPKNLCFIRNGIFITEDQKTPGIRRFSGFNNFLAIFRCLDPDGNELLRQMENPSHNQFEEDRPAEEREKMKARGAMSALSEWVIKELKNHAKNKPNGVTNIEDLNEWFGYEGDEGEGGIDEPNPSGATILLKKLKIYHPSPPKVAIPNVDPEVDPDDPMIPTPGPTPPRPRPSPLHRKKLEFQPTGDPRLIRIGPKKFKYLVTPLFSGEAIIRLYKSGSDFSWPLKLRTINDEKLSTSQFKTNFISGERCEINFDLFEDFKGAIEIYLAKQIEDDPE